MSDDALTQLEALRRDEVERAREPLLSLRREQQDAREAHHVALLARSRAEAALTVARADFAQADSVLGLRVSERLIAATRADFAREVSACERTTQRCRAADQALRTGEQGLRAAELARRAVSRTREQRAHDVSVRTERRLEDEAEDAHRSARQLGIGVFSTRV